MICSTQSMHMQRRTMDTTTTTTTSPTNRGRFAVIITRKDSTQETLRYRNCNQALDAARNHVNGAVIVSVYHLTEGKRIWTSHANAS